ncbi:hypothetical protein [Roseovarius sp.]|uniref:hypothetical protein n=1 Tax=Roseovarius sp. TaxID=1486281 RepID=UPI0026082930|nr:hypothetical protein [Roseovarius sp.]MDM8164654.1 hypothetical protein [Roseovarius sp.]
MTGGRRHRRRLRLPGACLVLLFAFYAGLAPGTMPAWMNGALTLVLCTGGETVTVTLDENGNPVERTHQRCDWSVQLLAADTAAPAPALPRPATAHPAEAEIRAFAARVAPPFLLQSPRAPPRLL